MSLTRCPRKEATIEEVGIGEADDNDAGFLLTEDDKPKVKCLERLEEDVRQNEISKVLEYNILRSNSNIQLWKSYPGISNIVDIIIIVLCINPHPSGGV